MPDLGDHDAAISVFTFRNPHMTHDGIRNAPVG
jgi:hypothetical protein